MAVFVVWAPLQPLRWAWSWAGPLGFHFRTAGFSMHSLSRHVQPLALWLVDRPGMRVSCTENPAQRTCSPQRITSPSAQQPAAFVLFSLHFQRCS